jgi:hypothetical protein
MKAFKYQVRVDNDLVHPWSGHIITEIFVPKKNLFFNDDHGIFIDLAGEETYKARLDTLNRPTEVTEINIKSAFVEKLHIVAKSKDSVSKLIDKIFKK